MKPERLVTVGIAVKDCVGHIFDAVSSVMNQSYSGWELLIIDDGSRDGTAEILRKFSDSRIRIFTQREPKGLAHNLNRMVSDAAHPYFVRMDADDVMHPKRLERQITELESDSRPDVVGSRAFMINERNEILGRFRERPNVGNRADALRSITFTHPTVAGRRTWFAANPYDESLLRAQDKDLWLRTISTSKFQKIDDCLLYYRINSVTGSPQYRNKCLVDRRLARLYGPSLVGRWSTRRILAQSYLKEFAYNCAQQNKGLARQLQSRRFEELSEAAYEQASADFVAARAGRSQ